MLVFKCFHAIGVPRPGSATLDALRKEGQADAVEVERAIHRLGIDSEKVDPAAI